MIEIMWEDMPERPELTKTISHAADIALLKEGGKGDVTILVVAEERIQSLNREFRHKDAVTDLLTFPAWEGEKLTAPPDGYLGDIALCLARAEEQAAAYGHSLQRECGFLAVHGILHLIGYDHMTPEDEKTMIARQKEIMEETGLSR